MTLRTPRTQALAYRIWAYANPLEWDCTIGEIAEHLDENINTIRAICVYKGWHHRLRTVTTAHGEAAIVLHNETMIDDLHRWA